MGEEQNPMSSGMIDLKTREVFRDYVVGKGHTCGANPDDSSALSRRLMLAVFLGVEMERIPERAFAGMMTWVEGASEDDLQYVFTGEECDND